MFGIFRKRPKASTRQELRPVAAADAVRLPEEVVQLLRRRDDLNVFDLRINLLSERASSSLSSAFQSKGIGRRLGLVVLDDAQDSNPYCYMTQGVAAGMVVHFNHDPEPKIEFADLDSFESYLRSLRSTGQTLGNLEVGTPAHPRQADLSDALVALAAEEHDPDAESQLCLYLPLLRGPHRSLLQGLAAHRSFFVREALADAIGAFNLPESEPILNALMFDEHTQVVSAATKAAYRLRHAGSGA